MNIYYGILDNKIDVTDICLEKLTKNNIIYIPSGDANRTVFFTDPLLGVHKCIIILNNNVLTEYDEFTELTINIIDNTIQLDVIYQKLTKIHSKLKIKYGSLKDELPEQKMVVRYLKGHEKVLEIGGNIGRNSLVIASILDNPSNFVTLESDVNIAEQLKENMVLNNLNFHIESSALSNRTLIQSGWNTIPSDILQKGYKFVNTITLSNLINKYNIVFDTLVLDCEGAFYYILMDMPEILNNINLIIMENDYFEKSKKNYVDEILKKNNFVVDYKESGGWGCCFDNFFEVWKKRQ
jgi:FkbM family methyltransferase